MQIMKNTQISLQMLALLPDSLKGIDLVDWQGYYNQEKAGTFKMAIRALVPRRPKSRYLTEPTSSTP